MRGDSVTLGQVTAPTVMSPAQHVWGKCLSSCHSCLSPFISLLISPFSLMHLEDTLGSSRVDPPSH